MPKNTIFIVIDSLYYDRTIASKNHNATMPFLDKLRSEGITCSNMYSEAPYTEAALVSLLCGRDTLKNGGYLKKLYGHKTIMESFKENGYDTFCNAVQPLVYPSYSYQGLTDEYYNICYEFGTLWSYRLEFYSKEYKTNGLNDETLKVIADMIKDNLVTWINFLKSLQNHDKIVSFIEPYVNPVDLDKTLKEVENEYQLFKKNQIQYTKEVLTKGQDHRVFKIRNYNLSKKMSYENMVKVNKRYKPIIRKMLIKNTRYNLLNNRLVLTPKEERTGLIKAYINAIYHRFLYDKIDYKIASKKAAPSMDMHFKHFTSWLENRTSKKPYFAYIHVDDCHRHEMFYSYDATDFNQLDEEFKSINDYMDNLPKKYYGNLAYDVSLKYADNCLKKLYTYLEEHKLLDDVNIVICADHGSSYTFAPYRSNYVNNVHRENYNMPLVIWGKGIKHKEDNNFHNTKDIPATLLDLNNLTIPSFYEGKSILKGKGRDYVLLENVNGGCPDYNLREFYLGIRNKNYLVVMNLSANKTFEEGTINSVYNLKVDPRELHNLKDSIDKKEIEKELNIIKKEFEILKKDMKENNFLISSKK